MTTLRLFGEIARQLDRYSRVTLPHSFQPDFAAGVVITCGIDKCLMAFPLDEWQQLAQKIDGLPLLNPLARDFSRLMYSSTNRLALDRDGRLLIPRPLCDYAGLERDIVVVGLGTHLEIWSLEVWRERRRALELSGLDDAAHWAALQI